MRLLARSVLLVAAALSFACANKPEPEPKPVADSRSLRTPPAGPVVGFVGRYDAHAWRGIPFAEPPVGPLRWRAPQPASAWSSPRQALAFGSLCTQFSSNLGDVDVEAGTPIGGEDCLTLDIYAPVFEASALPQGEQRLPVMLWIHGGGNTIGHSSEYDGGHLASAEKWWSDRELPPRPLRMVPPPGAGRTTAGARRQLRHADLIAASSGSRHIAASRRSRQSHVFGESAAGATWCSCWSPAPRSFPDAIVQSGGLRSHTHGRQRTTATTRSPGTPARPGRSR